MESFVDRTHVRLRSREHGTYLHADEDGWGVSLSPHRASLNTAWTVHLVTLPQTGNTCVLLHSAAYGRYLGVRNEYAPHPVLRVVQCLYDAPLQADVMWEAVSTQDGSGDVFLSPLRVEAPIQWNNSTWTVELIPRRVEPPPLPEQMPNGVVAPVVLRRMIRYIRADNSGVFILASKGTLQFNHRFLLDLIGDLAEELNDAINSITLCVRAGSFARITPLVVDPPLSEETMDVVVLTTGSPVALELRHPDVDAA